MSNRVCVGIVHDDCLEAPFVVSLATLLRNRPTEIDQVIMVQGLIGRLDAGRNQVFKNFMLRSRADWLLFVDTDSVFTPEDFDALLGRAEDEDLKIVSGLYLRGDGKPCMFRWDRSGYARVVEDYKTGRRDDELVSVDSVGFGFILVHRSVVEAMPDHEWCDNSRRGPAGQPLADDFSFCYRAKSELGYSIYVDTSIKIGHAKQQILRPE